MYNIVYIIVYIIIAWHYKTKLLLYKSFQTSSYWPTNIIFFRATNAAKPIGITTYRAAITFKNYHES